MEEFTITTRLDLKEYLKTMYIKWYRRPISIIAVVLGIYLLVSAIRDLTAYPELTYWDRSFELFLGAFSLLFPSIIIFVAYRRLSKSKVALQEISYTFHEGGVRTSGETFHTEFTWDHIIKRAEAGRYLILYHTAAAGNFIDKTCLTEPQLAWIRSKVKKG